jgi:NTP pyrophosphatase (non-canonical NTP hydrolase)
MRTDEAPHLTIFRTAVTGDDKSPQERIYKAIEARGYVGDWTRDELIGRHLLKLIEEMGETAATIAVPGADIFWPWKKLSLAAERSRVLFDHGDKRTWEGIEIDMDALKREMADCAVVLFSLAQVVGIDLVAVAMEKATADVSRGVRRQ